MAVKWMTYIWEERADLKGAELLLAVAIADHADNDGKCYPGIDSLCKKMRLKERQVQGLIKRLEQKNVFDVERGNGRGNMTGFIFKKVQDSAPFKPTEKVQVSTPFSKKKGAGFCTERVQVSATPPTPPYKDNHLIEPECGEHTPAPEQFHLSVRNLNSHEEEKSFVPRSDEFEESEVITLFEQTFRVTVGNAFATEAVSRVKNLSVWRALIRDKISFADASEYKRRNIVNWILTAYDERIEKGERNGNGNHKKSNADIIDEWTDYFSAQVQSNSGRH